MLCLWLLNSGSSVASSNKVAPEYHLRFWVGQSASLLGCVLSQGTFYIACHSMAWILAHLQMWLMIPCLARSLKCSSVLVISSGVLQKEDNLPQFIIEQLPVWVSCLVEVEGLQRSSKSYLSLCCLLCLAEGMLELSLLWVTGSLCYQWELVPLPPLLHASSQMHFWTMLCPELVVKAWFAQKWLCCLYLTEARSSICHERQTNNT